MRVVIVQDYLRSGGTEKQAVFLANALSVEGCQVTLITFRPGGRLEEKGPNVPYRRLSLQGRDCKLNWWAPGLVKAVKDCQPDITLLMGRNGNGVGGYLRWRGVGGRLVATYRTGRRLTPMYRLSLRWADAVVSNAEYPLARLRKLGVQSERLHVIANALTRQWPEGGEEMRRQQREGFGLSEDCLTLVNVQMFRPGKNKLGLIDIVAGWSRLKNWSLILVGDGDDFDACQQRIDVKGLRDRVHLVGYQKDAWPWYVMADGVVSASLEESLPNFLVEAQSMGLPVIAYGVAGTGECFVPDSTGYLVQANNVTHFRRALTQWADLTLAQRSEMSERAKAFAAERFSPSKQTEAYLSLFRSLLG